MLQNLRIPHAADGAQIDPGQENTMAGSRVTKQIETKKTTASSRTLLFILFPFRELMTPIQEQELFFLLILQDFVGRLQSVSRILSAFDLAYFFYYQ